jgi:endoplasmic reticulum lectin 1
MLFFQLIYVFLFLIPLINTILDDDILYDIKWQPELTSPIELDNSYVFTSKRKENYLCALPTPQTTILTSTEHIPLTEVQTLLESLHSKKLCAYRLDPYWTYELCHGTHLRQYHDMKVGGKKAILQEYYLGYYHPANQDILTDSDGKQLVKIHYKTIDNKKTPMLPVRYTDGTACDINSNQPRETTVYYICDERGNDGILNFEEISTCYYEMTIASRWLCKLPSFSPSEPNRHSINCYPKENARQKPRNLKKLEDDRQMSLKKGGRAQFTMTSADGTTFIIAYQYANDGDLDELAEAAARELTSKVTQASPVEQPEEVGHQQQQQQQQPPLGNLGADVDREFLEGFLSGRECLPGGTGWWRYEICYGKHVIQFHEEGQHRTSILLGTWNRDKHIAWLNKNPKKRPAGNIRDRQFVSLYYTDGDMCEATKTRRVVEVKLRCPKNSDKSHATSMYLVEPETCSYVMGVESSLFCNLIDYTDEYGIPDREKLIKRFQSPEQ